MLRFSWIPSQTSRQIGTTKKANPNYRATRWLLSLSRWIPELFIIYPPAAKRPNEREHKRRRRRRRGRARSGTNRPFYGLARLVAQQQQQQPPCAPHPHPVCVCCWFWYRPTIPFAASFAQVECTAARQAKSWGCLGHFFPLKPIVRTSVFFEIAKSIEKRLL